MNNFSWEGGWSRIEWIRVASLAMVTILLWCATMDRWTPASWQTPLDYRGDPQTGDVMMHLAWIKASSEGHVLPFTFTNVPELGAPAVANWDDFPTPERPIFWMAGFLAKGFGLFAGANLAILIEYILAALAFYAACRLGGGTWVWSMVGGLVYSFSRFVFAQGLHHITVVYCWHVPLCLLVCAWGLRGTGLRLGEGRHFFALAVAFVTGMQNIYYTWMFLQLVAIGGLYQAWRGGWRQLLAPVTLVASCALAILLVNSSTFAYEIANGYNGDAVLRDYKWLEIYGLKLVDLVVPPPDHPFPPLAIWGTHHLAEIFLEPGERPPSAYFGVLGLAATVWLLLASLRRVVNRASPPLEALIFLWIVLYAATGGLNGILGSMGFLMFRAMSRYSIVLLCLVLMYAVRRLSAIRFQPPVLACWLAGGAAVLGWWDQTPPIVTDAQLGEIQAEVASDRDFVAAIEQQLSPGAMIFQFPVMDFPEVPVRGVGSYEHLRPYLYSHQLRFSFGTDKGRDAANWQHQFEGLSLDAILPQLQSAGFSAIYIDREGYPDHAVGIENGFRSLGFNNIIQSARGDLFCVVLRKP